MFETVTAYRARSIDLEQWRPALQTAYTDDFIKALYPKRPYLSQIEPSALANYLQTIGAVYLDQKNAISVGRAEAIDWRTKDTHRKQLAKIAKTAAKLKLQIEELEKPAADLMWLPISDRITELMSSSPREFGDQIATYKDGRTAPVFLLNNEHLSTALMVIETLAQGAFEILPKDKGGRPDHPGLSRWLESMHTLWTQVLSQPFQLTNGEHGMSAAVAFFIDVMAPLDSEIGAATLHSAMRTLRGELSQRTRRDQRLAKTLDQKLGAIPIHIA